MGLEMSTRAKAAGRAARQQDGQCARGAAAVSPAALTDLGGWLNTYRSLESNAINSIAHCLPHGTKRPISLKTVQIKPATVVAHKSPPWRGLDRIKGRNSAAQWLSRPLKNPRRRWRRPVRSEAIGEHPDGR